MNEYKETIGVLERAFKLLEIICKEKEFTSQTIAKKLNCSERTARRYIEKIRYLFEDQIERKKGYKYVWKGLPSIEKKILESPNMRLFLAFVELGRKVGDDKSFWDEIWKSFNNKPREINEIIIGNVIQFEKIKDKKVKLEEAIDRGKVIKFRYNKSKKYFRVEPYKVILSNGFWYLVGIDVKEGIAKTFAIDMMENIEIEEDSAFEKTRNMRKIKEIIRKADNVIQITDVNEKEEIEIEVFKKISNYFERKEILTDQKILEKYKNGNLRIKFTVINPFDFKVQTFQWIPFFKVIKPEKYKNYLKEELERGLELFKL